MKSFSTGLVAAIIVGAIGLIILRSMGTITLPSFLKVSPSPAASIEPQFEIAPIESSAPSASVSPTVAPSSSPHATTKGGIVLGEDTDTQPTPKPTIKKVTSTTTTTTTTTTHYVYTLAKTSDCPTTITAELKDISASLAVQYRIRDNYSAAIAIWNEKGEELAGQKLYTGNGKIIDTGSAKSIKVVIQPSKCSDIDDTWLEVIASR